MKIELKNLKINLRFSRETTMFEADLYIGNTKVGTANNEGHGGCTNYSAFPQKYKPILKAAEEYCSKLPKKDGYPQTLESVIDDIVYDELDRKEEAKLKTTLKRIEKNSIIITKDPENDIKSYNQLKFKYPIDTILQTEKGKLVIKETIAKYISEGYRILNTNIPKNL